MATRIRTHAWRETSLGPIEEWPVALTATINLVLASPVPMQLLWGAELLVFYNDAFRQQLGLIDLDALGTPAQVVWKDAWPSVEHKLMATMKTAAVTDEKRAVVPVNRTGSVEESYWDFSYSPIFNGDGSVGGVLNISRDVTKEVLAERALQKSERRSDQILRSIGDAVIVTDTDSNVTRMNRLSEDLTGWRSVEALGQPLSKVFSIVHADTREAMESPAAKVLRLGTVVGLANHTILIRRDGTDVHIEDSGAPIYDDEGNFQGIVLVFRDVTAQREAEAVLGQAIQNSVRSEADLKIITDSLPAYVSYLDRNLRYVRVNRAYEDLLGRSAELIIGKTIDQVLGAAAAETVRPPLKRALAGSLQHFTYEITENGITRILSVSHIPDVAPDGAVRGVVVEAHDVTEQKRLEQSLKRSEDRFRSLIERSSVGLAIGTTSGELSYLNPALLKLLGYTADEVKQGLVRWDTITPDTFAEQDGRAIKELKEHGIATPYEKVYLTKDGAAVPLLIGASVISGESPNNPDEDIAVFATDLTMQKRAEQVLLQTEKLAAVGKLAASVSHEINNPLEAVTNLLYIARQDRELSQVTRELLDSADRELARVAQVTSQTLRFHRQSTAATDVHIEELVEEVLRLFGARLINSKIEIRRRYEPRVHVICFEGDIRQVLANVVGNAIDAMKKGGLLTIRIRYAIRWSTAEPGVNITVCDTGSGMSEDTRSRLFEAFYTTKGINGTGLGLWISSRIILKHRGYIRAYSSQSSKHHGSILSVWLPLELAQTASESWQQAL